MPESTKSKILLVHGCAILLGNKGILIRGPSGSGKSRTARLLVEGAQRDGSFACWVADDQVQLTVLFQGILAQAPDTIAGLSERRFSGIDKIQYEKIARLDLVVDLLPIEQIERLPEENPVSLHNNAKPLPLIKAPENQPQLASEIVSGYSPVR